MTTPQAGGPAAPELVVVLHAGTMKSGTTYLQSRLERHRDLLAADGILFPGPQWKDQMRAVGDALARGRAGEDLASGGGRWAMMAAQLRGWSGPRAVLSVEHLVRADRAQVEAVLTSLRPAAVEVVLTVRDLGRTIPSAWQQDIKGGHDEAFEDFVHALAEPGQPRSPRVRRFWKLHDAAVHAERWVQTVGTGRVRVVTVPPADGEPDLLWQRFSTACGLASDRYPAPDLDLVLNPSMGAAGAEILRRLNAELGDALDEGARRDLVKFTLGNATLAGQSDDLPRRVPAAYQDWLLQRSQQLIDGLRDSGADIVGDLDDLMPDRRGPADAPPTQRALADAAVRATAALLRRPATAVAADRPGQGRGRGNRRSVLGEQARAARDRAERGGTRSS